VFSILEKNIDKLDSSRWHSNIWW